MEPALEDVAREYEGEVKIMKLNVDSNPAIQERYNVQGIPALILFRDGVERERITGRVPRSTIAAAIERLVADQA
jgi:thioredoxin 1